MKKLALTFLALVLTLCSVTAQLARVQIIHNSPDPTVDVYAGPTLLLNDFAFRTAQPFIDLPSGFPIQVGIAPSTSTSVADAIFTETITLEAGKTYIVSASGVVFNTNTPFNLNINPNARETAANPSKVDISVFHGGPDAPPVDIAVRGGANIVGNVAYGEYTPYVSVDPGVYYIDVKVAGTNTIAKTYRADLTSLTGQAVCVFASGFLDSNNGVPFGLFVALNDGTVIPLVESPVARIQVVHNSPSPTVDVWMNGGLAIDNFEFRTARPFKYVVAGTPNEFAIAPDTSTSPNSAIATFPVTFENGKTYIVTAQGIVNDPLTGFYLNADPNGRERAVVPTKVDVAVLHGSPNAPPVDVTLYNSSTKLFENVAYGESRPYISLDPGIYYIDVKPAGGSTAVATFKADLSGLAGQPVYVVASGLLFGTPAFGLYAVLADGSMIALPQETPPALGTARVQVIHNSPDPVVDIYNGDTLLLNDFSFRQATPFIDLPSGVQINLGVAPATSQSSADVIATFPVLLETNQKYVVVASGILGNATTPFELIIVEDARESALDANKIDVLVFHGSPNAPAVDVNEVFTGNLISNLAYGEYTSYLSLDPGIYDLDVNVAGTSTTAATFRANLVGLDGNAAFVFASGLLNGTPGFGLFAALPNGLVVPLPATPLAKVQVIHNSPEPTVDVYIGNRLLLDNFEFRTATPFVSLPAGRDFNIGIAPSTSTSAAESIATFPANLNAAKKYTVFAGGVVGSPTTPFSLFIADDARETSPAGTNSVSVFHGSPDAPAVDVAERTGGTLIGDLAFGENSPYLELPGAAYVIDVKPAGTSTIAATFLADLTGLNGVAMRVFASGYLNGTPAFGLYAALANGTVIELPAIRIARIQVVHNSPTPTVDVYAGADLLIDDFEYQTATGFFYVPADVEIPIGVAPGTSQSVNDVLATFPVTLENGGSYAVVASGVVGNAITPFTLIVKDNARERAVDPTKLELAVLHGANDAPPVDIVPFGSDANLLSGLAYGDFTDYLALDPDVYILDIKPENTPGTVVGTFGGDFSPFTNVAGFLMASGSITGTPPFDILLVLTNGQVFPLPSYARVNVIHNSPSPTVDVYYRDEVNVNGFSVINDFEFRSATGIGLLPARFPFQLAVAPGTSTSINDAIYTSPELTLETGRTYIVVAAGEVGGAQPFGLYINDLGRFIGLASNNADLMLFHGAPDAPEVDVTLPNGTPIFDNVAYGEFANYISVPAASYIINVTPANDNSTIVQSYTANLTGLAGEAAVVFASGYLNPTGSQPGFEVWVALNDGVTFPLPVYVSTNELDNKVLRLATSPNPVVDQMWVRFGLSDQESLRYRVLDMTGRMVQEGDFGSVPAGNFEQRLDTGALNAGMYLFELVSDQGARTVKFVKN